jgi:hypothetical protein
MRRRIALTAVLLAAALPAPASADWEPFQLPPPPGGEFSTPVGLPGDLKFWAPNRGLMTVGGNNAVPEGIYSWDGVGWHQLATVCGGGRLAWAGPREFWTTARPSLPRIQSQGKALCHFRDGAVVGSFSTPDTVADPFHPMTAGACSGPNDCWFGGQLAQDASGQREGAFHVRWDGQRLRTSYNPEGGQVTGMLARGSELLESVQPDPELAEEAPSHLLHRIAAGGIFSNDPFTPRPVPGFGVNPTTVNALDGAGDVVWAVGGGVGPSRRLPFAAWRQGDVWHELEFGLQDGLTAADVFTDVAAVPGTRTAWAVLRGHDDGLGDTVASTRVALIDGTTGEVDIHVLAGSDDPVRGAALHVACPAADDCWLATARGFLYRNSTAGLYERDTDPAFQGTITVRPNEAAEQSIPDSPPEDDSRVHAPPIDRTPPPPPAEPPTCRPAPSAIGRVRKPLVRGRRLVVRFRLRRSARVRIVAYRKRKVVARTSLRRLKPGQRRIALRVSRRRWPTRLRFVIREGKRPAPRCGGGGGGSGDEVVTSGPAR